MSAPISSSSRAKPYLFAVVTVAAATLLRFALNPYLGDRAAMLIFTLPVAICATLCGLRASLMATVLSIFSDMYFFVGGTRNFPYMDSGAGVRIGLFACVATVISALGWLFHRSEIAHDRTREHALLRSLEESEQTARALLETTAQAIVGINDEGEIRLVNKAAEDMFGYTRAELQGQTLELLLPDRIRARHAVLRKEYFSCPRSRPMGQGMDLTARRRDGSVFPIEVSINVCNTPAGRMAVSFITDITRRKQIENDLLVERSQLKSILEYSPLLVCIKDLEGKIIIANQSFADVLGNSQKNILGKGIFDLLPPDVAKHVWQRDQEAMRSGGPVREEEDIRVKDGTSRTYATVRFPVSDINPLEPFGLCTFSLDVTEQKEAERRALHAAQHDPLTDLPNRALVYEFGNHLLATATRTGAACAVLFFDLDRFKPIIWAQMTVDKELGLVYLPVETPTGDQHGGHRPGNNLFAESLVALNLKTGQRK
ncbi:MAG: PAS domain S-box protein [Vicinamibacterales bacterium]